MISHINYNGFFISHLFMFPALLASYVYLLITSLPEKMGDDLAL